MLSARPGPLNPGAYVSALTASSHAPLPRSGFVLRPGADHFDQHIKDGGLLWKPRRGISI